VLPSTAEFKQTDAVALRFLNSMHQQEIMEYAKQGESRCNVTRHSSDVISKGDSDECNKLWDAAKSLSFW
jgi:hypothetical protein